jgi:hypothetical protein
MVPRDPRSQVEPLLAALEEASGVRDDQADDQPATVGTTGGGLKWKLFWAALVLAGLVALVIHQAF